MKTKTQLKHLFLSFGIAFVVAAIPPLYMFMPPLSVDASLEYSVDNFPEDASVKDKVIASVMYELGDIQIHDRPNYLSDEDLKAARKILQKGDVVLVGNFKALSSVAIGGPVTHTMLYVGDDKFIHSHAEGVETISMEEVFETYDTMIVVRLRQGNSAIIDAAVEYAYSQLGKPYDFNFEEGTEAFYCSELVNFVYNEAGAEAIEPNPEGSASTFANWMDVQAIHPIDFVGGDFRTVFISSSLSGNL
ncbi:hypothetical protein COW94_01615 [Candidatus Peregrinibacteria bacterium CG22_combo_CG10-13_8_21_14_all_44_10]|nr:MAG: hypothetical protein AUK45_02845 [Candidatus Peregrinibacteria bacterium CG2_30_44_17]PIP66465.1 MAG: hypothetical protein COW94_01615 [Candidatus Peregrinibacteria bacterium CG22_combo_CG10-13_8_21_14_all_44_10]PIS03539.1 MAG: hypothetical protein COT83_05500 [Candidatus Peregrinibacteria bacterium CG10_big_fil_rev_8_21_14_0_10_44_7]PJB89517.1 MAG: hypothetical protein CO082_00695 [Candidatus Peregrinibacteria bacterium CG_4_9_14_0_8_um_filter_44_15]